MVSKWRMYRLVLVYCACIIIYCQGDLQPQDNAIERESEGVKIGEVIPPKLIEIDAISTLLSPSVPKQVLFKPLEPLQRPPPPANVPLPSPQKEITPEVKHMPLQINHSKGFPNIYKKRSLAGEGDTLAQFVALGLYVFYPVLDGYNIILNSTIYKPKKVTVLNNDQHLEVITEGLVGTTIVQRQFFRERDEWHEYVDLFSVGRNTVVPLDINMLTDENDNYYTISEEKGGWEHTLFIPKEKFVFLPIVDGTEIVVECCFYYPHLVKVASKDAIKQMYTYANMKGVIKRRSFKSDETGKWSPTKGTSDHLGYRLLTLDVAKDKPENSNYTVGTDYSSIPKRHIFRAKLTFTFGSILYNDKLLFPPRYYADKITFSAGNRIDFSTKIPQMDLTISYVVDNNKKWCRLAKVETEFVTLYPFDISKAFHDDDIGFSQDDEVQERTANYRALSGILHDKIYKGDELVWSSDWRFMTWLKHEYLQSPKMFYMQTVSRQGDKKVLFFLEEDGTWHKVSGRQYVAMLAKRMEPISFDLDFVGADKVNVTRGPRTNRRYNMVRFRPHAGHYVKEITCMHKRIWSLKSVNDGICFFIRVHKTGDRWNCALYTFTPSGRIVVKLFQRLGNVWRSKRLAGTN